MVAVVTCDIIKSRQYSNNDRGTVNDLIKSAFEETIELLPNTNVDKLSFNIVQGDEFQFIVNTPALAYRFIVFYRLRLALKNLKSSFRAGIGFGEVAVDNDNSYKMDGPAFHRSRDAFQKFGKPKFRNRITHVISGNQELDDQIEIIAMYNDFIEQRWSIKQRNSIYLYEKYGSLKEAAKHDSVSLQALQQRIKVSGYSQMDFGFFKHTILVNSILQP
ncbi:MAG: SatD family protein [Candidatus Tenebribacter burtonii]|jgi:hypothetical protein|nr:SatD family protein [Candidatus Tenebribacter burtonii]